MNDERLRQIRERAEKATPGPWTNDGCDISDPIGRRICFIRDDDDADFMAHTREDIPALLAEVERLRERLADMARDTIVSFELEVLSPNNTIEKAKQILRDLGREDEIPDW